MPPLIVIVIFVSVLIGGIIGHWLGYRQAISDIEFETWMQGKELRNGE